MPSLAALVQNVFAGYVPALCCKPLQKELPATAAGATFMPFKFPCVVIRKTPASASTTENISVTVGFFFLRQDMIRRIKTGDWLCKIVHRLALENSMV